MRFISAAAAVSFFVALTVAQADFRGLPDCSLSCAIDTVGSCSTSDVKCICTNPELISELACCISDLCSTADQQATISFISTICSSYELSVPTSASCPTRSSQISSLSATGFRTGIPAPVAAPSGSPTSQGDSTTTTVTPPAGTSAGGSTGLSTAVSAGIGVSVAVGVLLSCAIGFFIFRVLAKKRKEETTSGGTDVETSYLDLPELGDSVHGKSISELNDPVRVEELDGSMSILSEMGTNDEPRAELEGS
ncbi:hypothetical protein P152DRAFT_481757 [Eremomyces bilateralis CBS 781.70]|uniref:CFEM domain-containing protein n=1 Tax=Eremomyces bilateralis CBS 781.70 TaxID=1392243 RepID=A0A6G1G470_9PEZI|nr:uncharacterized protein P152DRAFT_481757 [Eremomyces bilateralis CBS 781.70]KAF1812864.1 hypothetical protein P152DRAFT_481757 [Eremomyces bilateralis CBS 781.70]